ncbi:MAG: acyl-CoA dehydrogenase family protein [Candidatus Eisenbacteria bacterium]|nr:acyl-CoA dehydrogenase family protein [Candidatus Eisenbacteria bacterium]
MPDTTYLTWPFFDESHRPLATDLEAWCVREIAPRVEHEEADLDAACRDYVRRLGAGGWLAYLMPAAHGGVFAQPDLRSLCLIRETLGRYSPLADFCFALQGLGSFPISRFGTPEQQSHWLPRVRSGEVVTAFAISEPDGGSDVAAMTTSAEREGDDWVLSGTKTWISNAGIADYYVVFARWPEGGEKSFVALLVEGDRPGLDASERIEVMAPHPIGTLHFRDCRVPNGNLIGEPGGGLKVALATLDLFRSTVGAAALGYARRALDEAAAWSQTRRTYGKSLSEHQMTRAKLADMAVAVDAMALLVYRAGWVYDLGAGRRVTREAAMAKLFATEAASRVIDDAVQLFGGRGVMKGHPVERLYREIRALRIYEGASEIQKIIIANQVLTPEAARAARTPPDNT